MLIMIICQFYWWFCFFMLTWPWLVSATVVLYSLVAVAAKLWQQTLLLQNPFSLALLNAFGGICFIFWVNSFAFRCVYIVPLVCAHVLSVCSSGTASVIRPPTHTPETGSRNRHHIFDARFRRQSMTLEVVHRHEKLAPESGVEFWPLAPISGAGFWSVCQGL